MHKKHLLSGLSWNVMQATLRVLFPDGFVLEANFKSSETISVLLELVQKAIVRPELPFYICKILS